MEPMGKAIGGSGLPETLKPEPQVTLQVLDITLCISSPFGLLLSSCSSAQVYSPAQVCKLSAFEGPNETLSNPKP